MDKACKVFSDIEVLPSFFPIPGGGYLAVNSFIIKAKEPILVDTGMGIESGAFMKALESVIDPPDLKWVWLTHDDADHTGSIRQVLEAAPEARLAANALAVLRMSTGWQVPMDRVYWLNPGDCISAGDRTLTAVRPPLFDNPTTIGFFDSRSEVFFSADFFGAIIPIPVLNGEDIAEEDLAAGMMMWAAADSPWIHMVGSEEFGKALDRIRQFAPKMFLSSHLPATLRNPGKYLDLLTKLPASDPFVAPDQTALEQILAKR